MSRSVVEAVFILDRDLRHLVAQGEVLATAEFKHGDLLGRTITEALPP